MSPNEKNTPFRVLFLITSPKLAEKATKLFYDGSIPVQYRLNATGTASSEMMDILGLGSSDKSILINMLPKHFADKILKKLNKELKLGSVNSGIAFTLPISGANNLILRMLAQLNDEEFKQPERKEESVMPDNKYSMIATVVNQGYSEDVMDAARTVGATGGTVVHSRRIGNEQTMGFWGLSIQEEKDMVFIVASNENKLKIMKAIGEKCGMHSEAKGVVVSLPIDTVIGLEEN